MSIQRRRFMQAVSVSSVTVIAGCISDISPESSTGDDDGANDDDAGNDDGSTDDDKDRVPELTGYTVSESVVTPAVEHRSDMDAWGVFVGSETVAEEYFESVDEDDAEEVRQFVDETDFGAGDYLLYVEAYAPQTCYELILGDNPEVAENGLPNVALEVNRIQPDEQPCGDAMTAVDLLVRLSFDLGKGGPVDIIEVTVAEHRDEPEDLTIETIREIEPTETDTETAEPEAVEDIEIVLTNYATAKQRGDLTLSADTETILEEKFEIGTDDQQSVDTEITEPGQYNLTVTTEAGPETSFPFSIDEYDLKTGSNLIVEIGDEDIMVMMQE